MPTYRYSDSCTNTGAYHITHGDAPQVVQELAQKPSLLKGRGTILDLAPDHRGGLAVPGINDLFLDQPLIIYFNAGIDITAHGAHGFAISLRVPSYGDPVRGNAVASLVGFLDKKMLDVMLSATPVGAREKMGRESPGTALGSLPSFPSDILDNTIERKGSDDTLNVTCIHAPHITRQRVVNRLTIFEANCIS